MRKLMESSELKLGILVTVQGQTKLQKQAVTNERDSVFQTCCQGRTPHVAYYKVQERVPLLLSLAGDAHPGRSENGAYGSLREAVWIVGGSVAVGVHLGVTPKIWLKIDTWGNRNSRFRHTPKIWLKIDIWGNQNYRFRHISKISLKIDTWGNRIIRFRHISKIWLKIDPWGNRNFRFWHNRIFISD